MVQVHGTGTWYPVHGTSYVVHGILGTWYMYLVLEIAGSLPNRIHNGSSCIAEYSRPRHAFGRRTVEMKMRSAASGSASGDNQNASPR